MTTPHERIAEIEVLFQAANDRIAGASEAVERLDLRAGDED